MTTFLRIIKFRANLRDINPNFICCFRFACEAGTSLNINGLPVPVTVKAEETTAPAEVANGITISQNILEENPFGSDGEFDNFETPQGQLKEELTWICDICHREFPDLMELDSHKSANSCKPPTTNSPKPIQKLAHQCSDCAASFSRYNSLALHSRIHHPTGTATVFNCTFCPETFTQRALFLTHQLIHTGVRYLEAK